MDVTMIQHPVGQGGLFSGTIRAGGRPFRWAYDCGSNQLDSLKREIDEVARGGPIDMLFLSHFDSDHVCGIDLLLTQCEVREVVIPYFEQEVLFALVAQDIARGRLSTTFTQLVGNIPAWFDARGVSRVTRVRGDEGEGEGGPVPELPTGGPGDGDIEPKWIPDAEPWLHPDLPVRLLAREVASNSSVTLEPSSGGCLNWGLIPYVHLPPERLMAAFKSALEAEFGSPPNRTTVSDAARTSDGRSRLRRCYDALWLDHNLVSMTLYSGPLTRHNGTSSRRRYSSDGERQGGWVHTGDAHFQSRQRATRLSKHYARVQALADVLMMPHHGSAYNFSPALLDCFSNFFIGYAAVGPNSYGHPHKDVIDVVNERAHFLQVTDERSTRLQFEVAVGR